MWWNQLIGALQWTLEPCPTPGIIRLALRLGGTLELLIPGNHGTIAINQVLSSSVQVRRFTYLATVTGLVSHPCQLSMCSLNCLIHYCATPDPPDCKWLTA